MSSRLTSRKASRAGSMEDEEGKDNASSTRSVRTAGGKIINRLEKNDLRDSNQLEQIPDPFAAE